MPSNTRRGRGNRVYLDTEIEAGLIGLTIGGMPIAVPYILGGPFIAIGPPMAFGPLAIQAPPRLPSTASRNNYVPGPAGMASPALLANTSTAKASTANAPSAAPPTATSPAARTYTSRVADMGPNPSGMWNGIPFTVSASVNGPRDVIAPMSATTLSAQRYRLKHSCIPSLGSAKSMFIYIAGACTTNNKPRGGYAFVFRPGSTGKHSGVLERRGPAGGDPVPATSSRAELRAVLAALHFRDWYGDEEGFKKVVVVTVSEYIEKGATEQIKVWVERGWKTAKGKGVANRDMWEALSERLGVFAGAGCEVAFWKVPKEWNAVAAAAARDAAAEGKQEDEYVDVQGSGV